MSERSSELGIAGASLSVLATGGSVYTFNIFVVCAEREREFLPGRRHATIYIYQYQELNPPYDIKRKK